MTSISSRFKEILNNVSEKWLDVIVSAALGPTLTNQVLTSVVTDVAREIVDKFVRERFTESQAKDIRDRAKEAAVRIEEASKIISELQFELQSKNAELEQLMDVVAKRQDEATHWANLANVNEELASSFTRELEKRVREQLRAELDKGKQRRQILGIISWVVTLLIGAVVGAIVQEWWQTGNLLPIGVTTPTP